MQDKLAIFNSAAKLADQRQVVGRISILIGAVDSKASSAALGDVHCHIRATQQRVCHITVLRRERYTNARSHSDVLAFDHEGRLQSP